MREISWTTNPRLDTPDVSSLKQEIAELKAELERIKEAQSSPSFEGNVDLSAT